MRESGRSRDRLAGILGAAFAEGLLSEQTLAYRLELLYAPGLVEPSRLVGDLPAVARTRAAQTRELLAARLAEMRATLRRVFVGEPPVPFVLALDWATARRSLTIGRSPSCDVAIREPTVSRRHALLRCRDGGWVIQDLGSKNGLTVNGRQVGRASVGPGDLLGLGLAVVELD